MAKIIGVLVKTLRVRIKDWHALALWELAGEVKLVRNFSQDLVLKVLDRANRFMLAFDMTEFTKEGSKEGLLVRGVRGDRPGIA